MDSGIWREVLVLTVLAVSILLFISNFGIGGIIGNAVSRFFFGIFGWMAYIFPVVLFFGTAFAAANRGNPLAVWKMSGLILLFLCLCGLVHLITLGYVAGDTIPDIIRSARSARAAEVCWAEELRRFSAPPSERLELMWYW